MAKSPRPAMVSVKEKPGRKQAPGPTEWTFRDARGQDRLVKLDAFRAENEHHLKRVKPPQRWHLEQLGKFTQRKVQHLRMSLWPDKVLWDEYQTPVRNQMDRNTCSGFAIVAAIEARYKRDHSLELDLSEQFFWHMYKSTSLDHPLVFRYENQSSFWGGGGPDGVRAAVNFCIPPETDAPYLDQAGMDRVRDSIPGAGTLAWDGDPARNTVTQDQVDAFEYSPAYISDAARQNARYGVKEYILLGGDDVRDPSRLEAYIATGHEVIVSANLKWKTRSDGVHDYDADARGGWHVFLVIGYDRTAATFTVKNSWGGTRHIEVSYNFARNCFNDGSIVTAVQDPDNATSKGRMVGQWAMNHDGWQGRLTVRRYTGERNDQTRLGHYTDANGNRSAVNGTATDDGRGIRFVTTGGPDTDPAATDGQAFHVDVFGWNVKRAAGSTTWNGIPFGACLDRDSIRSTYGRDYQPAKWTGSWSMEHDGWKGRLDVHRVFGLPIGGALVDATYTDSSGNAKPAWGHIPSDRNHVLELIIRFSGHEAQLFVLHFHTWTDNLASGYTFWRGMRFGAMAQKR